MALFILIFAVLLAAGLFLVLADLLKVPHLATAKAIMNTAKQEKHMTKTIEAWLMGGAVRLSKILHINEYKRVRLLNTLQVSGISQTPELFLAYALVKSFVVGLLAIPLLFFFPLLAPIVLVLAVLIYFKEAQRADNTLKERREHIEAELPRFVSNIEQELHSSRDVLSILESYKKNAGLEFCRELDIVCADMRSSSYEAALVRFESRLNSPHLSDVVRGLIGVLRGDNGILYFQMLTHDFKQDELRRLKAKAQKIPPKIKVLSFVMLGCFMLTYFVVLGMQIMSSLNGMF